VFRNEFEHPLEIRHFARVRLSGSLGRGPLPYLGARPLGARALGLGRKIGKDLFRIIRFSDARDLVLSLTGILKEFAERLRAFRLSCIGFHHERMGGPTASHDERGDAFL
jgi:hypothetical protein